MTLNSRFHDTEVIDAVLAMMAAFAGARVGEKKEYPDKSPKDTEEDARIDMVASIGSLTYYIEHTSIDVIRIVDDKGEKRWYRDVEAPKQRFIYEQLDGKASPYHLSNFDVCVASAIGSISSRKTADYFLKEIERRLRSIISPAEVNQRVELFSIEDPWNKDANNKKALCKVWIEPACTSGQGVFVTTTTIESCHIVGEDELNHLLNSALERKVGKLVKYQKARLASARTMLIIEVPCVNVDLAHKAFRAVQQTLRENTRKFLVDEVWLVIGSAHPSIYPLWLGDLDRYRPDNYIDERPMRFFRRRQCEWRVWFASKTNPKMT